MSCKVGQLTLIVMIVIEKAGVPGPLSRTSGLLDKLLSVKLMCLGDLFFNKFCRCGKTDMFLFPM